MARQTVFGATTRPGFYHWGKMPTMPSGLEQPSTLIQLFSLIVGVIGLVFLVQYVRHTKTIAEQTVAQTEATFKPAIIATQEGVITNPPRLRNVGKGAALDVEWELAGGKKKGRISCIEAGKDSGVGALDVNLHALESAAVMSGGNKVAINCSYKSISGAKYHSVSAFDFETSRFSTSFADAAPISSV